MAYQNKIIKKTSYDNIYRTFYFFHNEGDKSISIGKISKRPTNISKDKTILEIHERLEKLPVGPTIPNPGPTLLIHVATEEKAEVKSIFCNAMIKKEVQNIIKYNIKYV